MRGLGLVRGHVHVDMVMVDGVFSIGDERVVIGRICFKHILILNIYNVYIHIDISIDIHVRDVVIIPINF